MIMLRVILIVFAYASFSWAQPAPEIEWMHTYGGIDDDAAEWIEPIGDNGFVFCGGNCSGGNGNCQLAITRINNSGELIWQRTYGGPSYEYGEGLALKPDGGFIAVGTTDSYGAGGRDFFLVNTNAEGEPLWTRTYGGSESDIAHSVCLCTDSGYLLAGYSYSFGSYYSDMYFVKTNAEGTTQWSRAYGGVANDVCHYAIQTSDGGFIAAGSTYSYGEGECDIYIVKLNAEGNPEWTRTLGGVDRDYAEAIKQTQDGGYIVCGVTKSFGPDWHNAYLIKLSSDGNTIWQQAYGGQNPDYAMDVVECSDGSYFVAGGYRPTLSAPYMGWVFKINSGGELIWSRDVGGPSWDWLMQCRLTNDGGYIIAGKTESYGAGGEDAWVIRLESDHPQPDHHFESVPPSGLPYAIVVDSAIVDGAPLCEGDEIAVFDGDLCVGVSTVEVWPVSLTAWQGDSIHGMAGFVSGHPMAFRIWQRENDVDIPAVPMMITGDGNFGTGVYSRLSLSGEAYTTIEIPLRANYANLISFHVRPEEPTAEEIFGGIGSLVAAYEDNGHVFIPPNLNTIGEVRLTAGFRVYCTEPETLVVTGLPVNPMTEYTLHSGLWNWIGYPLAVSVPVETALSAIAEHLIVIQNDDGQAWIPGETINTLGTLEPGRGYMAIVDQTVTFHFDQTRIYSASDNGETIAVSPPSVISTGLPYAVVIQITDELRRLAPHRVDLYDGEYCVGGTIVPAGTGKFCATAWQGIAELDLQGFTPGHDISVMVHNAVGTEIPVHLTGMVRTYGSGGYAMLILDSETSVGGVPHEFAVGEGYPNPFNPQATIPFVIPETNGVRICIFNTLGQTVFESKQIYPAGANQFIIDMNEFASTPVSGVYFVRFDYPGSIQTRKVVLLR